MSVRVWSIVFYPDAVILPFAFAFFAILGYRRLWPAVIAERYRAIGAVSTATCGGVAGGCLYGLLGGPFRISGLPTEVDVQLGSFGGYWGLLAGTLAWACCTRQPFLRTADALVPGLLIGGTIARIACLLEGCCPGIHLGGEAAWFQPFRLWPLYDMAALLITFAAVSALPKRRPQFAFPGISLFLFLILYGSLRFAIEFVRQTPSAVGPFTWGQVMAGNQCLVGILACVAMARKQAHKLG